MKAIERAKEHFNSRAPKQVTVEAWADAQGRPLVLWVNPLTVKDRDHLIRLQRKYGSTMELLVHVLILHARDEKGEPVFTLEDKHDLMHNTDPDVLTATVNQFFDEVDPLALKKKLSPTPSSVSA
jgi:hypothetical protein